MLKVMLLITQLVSNSKATIIRLVFNKFDNQTGGVVDLSKIRVGADVRLSVDKFGLF